MKIGDAYWQEITNKWQDEITRYEAHLAAFNKADVPYYENGRKLLELAAYRRKARAHAKKPIPHNGRMGLSSSPAPHCGRRSNQDSALNGPHFYP